MDQQSPPPFLHAFEERIHRDNRHLTVYVRTTTAGVAPRGFNRFEGLVVIGVNEVTPVSRRTVPHQVLVPLPGVNDVGEAFMRFGEFMEPAVQAYLAELKQRASNQPRILKAGIAPQVPENGG